MEKVSLKVVRKVSGFMRELLIFFVLKYVIPSMIKLIWVDKLEKLVRSGLNSVRICQAMFKFSLGDDGLNYRKNLDMQIFAFKV